MQRSKAPPAPATANGLESAPASSLPPHLTDEKLQDSPFLELSRPFTAYEAFKFVLLIPFILPRSFLGCLALVIIAVINSLAVLGADLDQPIPSWRRAIIVCNVRCLLPVVFLCMGFHIKVKGREHLAAAHDLGAVAVFNHVSWLDAFVLVYLLQPSGVSIARNADIPVIGTAVRALQTVYIPTSKRKDANGVTDILRQRVDHPKYGKQGGYPLLVLAPEGTCSHGRCLLQFRTGAFVLGRPILPILFSYKHNHNNPAWTNLNELWQYVRIMCQWVNILEVTILPPYMPSAAELADAKLFTGSVRSLMSKKLGVPMVDQSQTDYVELVKAGIEVSWDGRRIIRKHKAD
mmetsp:Transcript_17337/g.29646  ORF Transcript_17337/g.29646 Transcript_17337/m.29646 type:complete len:348 (+) Transcript_17337:126-1169(+)|eukprot:CAMPEP_0119103180 /NCGR_PEP_ID=MMETSP1180-20130426/1690_1 /TAXON_ID=3052 ORGANISM="Chlamydomonas cf sp, Strain CCMP681" /NCGR_SAMPLE_ID=MMETSP1180 /ASSEMBLY_ACC=CAM_ASM_000741 /LENGTH=347 /DNA_ID=CAMNT_0007087625 /DNA_START=125 /DNA_END=1168 /DNA_ORIENTATION=+